MKIFEINNFKTDKVQIVLQFICMLLFLAYLFYYLFSLQLKNQRTNSSTLCRIISSKHLSSDRKLQVILSLGTRLPKHLSTSATSAII